MKKAALFIMLLTGTLTVKAGDYAYLTFETDDGTKVSVALTSLTLGISDGTLKAGAQNFILSNLKKMYFTASDETATGITTLEANSADIDGNAEIYDLRGQRVSKDQMRRGIYIVRSKNKTCKLFVQ